MSADSNASLPLMDVVSGRNLSSFTSASARASPDLT